MCPARLEAEAPTTALMAMVIWEFCRSTAGDAHGNVTRKNQIRGGARGEPGEAWNDLIVTIGW
jgi:hypothetical protein